MKYEIFIRADPGYENYIEAAHAAAQQTLQYTDTRPGHLTVVLTSSEYVQDLNREYRKVDKPTDVLSFESGEKNPETKKIYLGDVILAMPEVERQAEEGGHSAIAELNLLVVHGTLHLLKFDHKHPQQQEKMWSVQRKILTELQNEILGPDENE